MEKNKWFFAAMGCLLVSAVSLLLPVIIYGGKGYSAFALIANSAAFEKEVLCVYTGPVLWNIDAATTVFLALLAVIAVLCAVIGLITLRAQRPNTWQFVLTIIGLACIALPSLTLLISVIFLGKYFPERILFGAAPVVIPIAMGVCIAVVIRRKNYVAEQLRKELIAKGLIWKAGDLE